MIFVIVLGYWFRLSEVTACQLPGVTDPRCLLDNAKWWSMDGFEVFEKKNDLYLQNGAWAVFMTTFTVSFAGGFRA